MRRINFIALDVYSAFCEGGYVDDAGREKTAWRTPTRIPELVEAIEAIPRPRKLVIEEGPLADWLYRNLSPRVDEMVVCDPHRNALISKDGDKSDDLDWRKLAALYRGGEMNPPSAKLSAPSSQNTRFRLLPIQKGNLLRR